MMVEKEDLIQPKMLYCSTCNTFSEPDYRLICESCGKKLTTCWWALLRSKGARTLCEDCKNRFWCWTTVPDDSRIPSTMQVRIVQNQNHWRISNAT